MSTTDFPNDSFAISEAVSIETGRGGLPYLALSAGGSSAHIYLHGAHVTHFQPVDAEPVLFVSDEAVFGEGKAIRGGVPVIFPWFGANDQDPSLPSHGFARTRAWSVESTNVLDDRRVQVVLGLRDDEATRAVWPFAFAARFSVVLGETLEMELRIENTGDESFDYEDALHTYFQVGDVRKISLTGLEDTEYLDKVNGMQLAREGADPVSFKGETDRVYIDTESECVVHDPVMNRRIAIGKSGSRSTVVWNPWAEKSAAFADFGDDEWPGMVCVETCNVGRNAIALAPGADHATRATVQLA